MRIVARIFQGYAAGLRHHLHVCSSIIAAKPESVVAVGKKQLLSAQRCDRYGGVNGINDPYKALVRCTELTLDTVGLGNVGHG